MSLFLALALQAAAAGTPLQTWQQLGAPEGIQVAIDPASVHAEGGRVRVRIRATLPAPGPDGIASVTGTSEIDCAAGTATALDAKGYDTQGRLMFNGVVPQAQRHAEPIRPGSANAAVRTAVCAGPAR